MDTLVLQVWGWAWRKQLHLEKNTCYETSTKASEFESKVYEDSGKDFGTWNFRQILRLGLKCRNKYAKRMLRYRRWRSVEDTGA
jgi:predicted nucleotidyltransferase